MRTLFAFFIGVATCGGVIYYLQNNNGDEIASQLKEELLGYTAYKDYIQVSKQAISKQAKFITAIVTRDEGYTRKISKTNQLFTSDANVAITYKAKYSFGYDLSSDKYEIKETPYGIELIVDRPRLLIEPAILSKSYRINDTGWLVDEKLALLEIYKDIDKFALKEGEKLANTPTIQAMCEKQLVAFVRDFMMKQKGVKFIPFISVKYRN